jgi:hypothetical protein
VNPPGLVTLNESVKHFEANVAVAVAADGATSPFKKATEASVAVDGPVITKVSKSNLIYINKTVPQLDVIIFQHYFNT